jgi:hypothetical protein
VPQVLAQIEHSDEEAKFLRALTRTRGLMIRIRVTPESDFVALGNYWSGSGRNRDVLQMIEAVARTPGVERLDLAHLLPATPRRHLNAFPSERDGLGGRFPDDFWTAINFFNFQPTNRYHDSLDSSDYFNQRYEPVQGARQFGDVVLLSRVPDQHTFHACVFIADGIVYTKHDPNRLSPWVFTRLSTLEARHGGVGAITSSVWRKIAAPH